MFSAMSPVNSFAKDWMRSTRRAPSTTLAPLRGDKLGGRLAQPAARARDDDDFSSEVIAHTLDSRWP
jgi:hypothetical protein